MRDDTDMGRKRASITGDDLRRLGIPKTLMTDFEIAAAVERDGLWDDSRSGDDRLDMAAYDRRGLLNVVAALRDPAPDTLSEKPGLDARVRLDVLSRLVLEAAEGINDMRLNNHVRVALNEAAAYADPLRGYSSGHTRDLEAEVRNRLSGSTDSEGR